MRRYIVYLIVLLLSVFAGLLIAENPGYLLMSYHKWTIEMPLWFAIVAIFIAFYLFNLLLRIMRGLRTTPVRWQLKSLRRRNEKVQNLTQQGIFALIGEDWALANKKFQAILAKSQTWPHHLIAAYAAHQSNQPGSRDLNLQKASELSPDAKLVVGLLRSKYQFENQPEHAIAVLEHLRRTYPKQRYVLRYLAKNYYKLHDWDNIILLLPALRKQKALSEPVLAQLERSAYQGQMLNIEGNDLRQLHSIWAQIPKKLREDPLLIECYAKMLINFGAPYEAENLLAAAIPKHWNDELVNLFGSIHSEKPDKQLATAEKWLSQHDKDAGLLFILGDLCLRNQLWGKARRYFEMSLLNDPKPKTYQELGKLLEYLNEDPASIINCYKVGLQAVSIT